jgi:predicted negative regulator of RcsB-dependent stress response
VIVRGLLIALAVVIAWAGFQTVRAGRLKAEAVALRAENSTLEREATGQAEISTATETFHTRETIIREIASQAETEARDAPDATTPLSQERADRLRLNDQRVCLSAPAICADPDPAAGRPPALPPARPAG